MKYMTDNWALSKFKTSVNDVQTMKDKFKDWRETFEKITHLLKDVCRYKEPLRSNNKKTINLKGKKKWAKDSNMHLTKEDLWIASNHVKTCSTSLVIDMTCLVAQPCPIRWDCSPPGSSVLEFSRQENWSG